MIRLWENAWASGSTKAGTTSVDVVPLRRRPVVCPISRAHRLRTSRCPLTHRYQDSAQGCPSIDTTTIHGRHRGHEDSYVAGGSSSSHCIGGRRGHRRAPSPIRLPRFVSISMPNPCLPTPNELSATGKVRVGLGERRVQRAGAFASWLVGRWSPRWAGMGWVSRRLPDRPPHRESCAAGQSSDRRRFCREDLRIAASGLTR